jgi:hypothetical protein
MSSIIAGSDSLDYKLEATTSGLIGSYPKLPLTSEADADCESMMMNIDLPGMPGQLAVEAVARLTVVMPEDAYKSCRSVELRTQGGNLLSMQPSFPSFNAGSFKGKSQQIKDCSKPLSQVQSKHLEAAAEAAASGLKPAAALKLQPLKAN